MTTMTKDVLLQVGVIYNAGIQQCMEIYTNNNINGIYPLFLNPTDPIHKAHYGYVQ